MKKIFLIMILFSVITTQAQVLVNLQLPSSGVVQKSQLWNMAVTNTTNSPLTLHIELTFTDEGTGQQVMSAVTKIFILAPGTKQLNDIVLNPILYNVIGGGYPISPGPNGLLPVGDFEVCYSFMKHVSDATTKIVEQCEELNVEPLSPPQLIYPYDQTAIREFNPQFSWIPPAPSSLFVNLSYDFVLVELYPGQSASDGIQQNVPIYQRQNIHTTTLPYPVNATALELDKTYAWKIVARSNQSAAAQSEVWQFTIKEFHERDSLVDGFAPFARLKKEEPIGYAIFTGVLKFDYLNETTDTAWNVSLYDLSNNNAKLDFHLDSIHLKAGQNLFQLSVRDNNDFIDKHIYLMEVKNSRSELWKIRFEYRKPNEQEALQ